MIGRFGNCMGGGGVEEREREKSQGIVQIFILIKIFYLGKVQFIERGFFELGKNRDFRFFQDF